MIRLAAPVLLIAFTGCGRPAGTLTVSLAASLRGSIEEITSLYEREHRETQVVLNFGASGMLAQQIEQGAPADVFFSAAPQPMDALASKGLILAGTRRDLLRNQIVLVSPAESGLRSFQQLPELKLIAMGDPGSVPAGMYGREVLSSLGLWDRVQGKLVFAKDVRQVLTYVENGDADAGIVYATDARESGKVRIAEIAAENSHSPVVYPAAVLKGSWHPEAARAFIGFLISPAARTVFDRHGFTVLP
jgi:molybdate transport system substrate-binding protein